MFELTDQVLGKLNAMVAELPDDVPTFRGVPIDKFEKDDVIKICRLFADKMYKTQQDYYEVCRKRFGE